MASVLAKLLVKLSADSAEWQSGMQKAHKSTQNFEKQARASLDKVAKSAAAMSAAVGAATAVIVKQNLQSIDSLAKTADKLGITTEALGGLRHAANLSGVAQEKLDTSLQRMTRRLAEAAQGGGEAKGAIEELGLNAQKLVAMSPDRAFTEISAAMSDLENQSDKVRLAFKFFDSEGVALVNTMNMGAEGIEAAAREAEQLGMALSRVDAAKVEAANDAISRANGALAGIGQTMAVQFAPYIEAVANQLVTASKESGGFKNEITAALKAGIIGASYLADVWRGWELIFSGLKTGFGGLSMLVLQGMEQWDRAITDTINAATEAINTLVRGINQLPGVELPELEKAQYSQDLEALAQISEEYFDEVNAQFQQLASQPLPSDNIKTWLAEIEAAAEVAASKVAAVSPGMSAPSSFGEMGEDPAQAARSEKLAAQLLALEESLKTEEERIQSSYERRREMVNLAAEEGLLGQQRQFEILESLYLDHQERMNQIHNKGVGQRSTFLEKSFGDQVKTVAGGLSAMTAATAKENKTMFAINKAASASNAAISTYEAAISAYKALAGIPYVGPALGAAAAAAVGAFGAMQISSIASTSFGGTGSGGAVPSVAATGADSLTATVPAMNNDEAEPAGPVYNVYVQGNVIDHDQFAREMFDSIKKAENDGLGRG